MARRPSPINSLAFGLLSMTAFLITWNGVTVAGRKPADWCLFATFACTLAYVLVERPSICAPGWMLGGGAALIVSATVALVWPPDPSLIANPLQGQLAASTQGVAQTPHSNIGNLLRLEDVFVGIPIVVSLLARTRRRCWILANLWACSAIVSALVGIGDQIGLTHISPLQSTLANQSRAAGLTGQPNELGLSCALVIPVVVLWLLHGRRWKALGFLAFCALLGGIYVSGSRSAAIAGPVALGVTVLTTPRLRTRLPQVAPMAGILLVIVLMFSGAPGKIASQTRLASNSSLVSFSNQQRATVASQALDQIKARPLTGVGFEVVGDPHSIYLAIAASGGMLAVAGLALYGIGMVGIAARARRHQEPELSTVLAISLLIMLASGIVGTQIGEPYPFFSLGVLLSLATLAPVTRTGRGGRDDRRAQSPRPAAAGRMHLTSEFA